MLQSRLRKSATLQPAVIICSFDVTVIIQNHASLDVTYLSKMQGWSCV